MRTGFWSRSLAALVCLLIAKRASAVDYPYANVGPQNASINISSGSTTPFNNRLLGLNTNFPENLYGLDGYNDADGQALITEWNPPALRFPHGVWSNFYDWEVDGRRIYDGYDGIYRDAVVNVPQLRYGFDGFNTLHDGLAFDVLHTWNINYDSPEKGVRRLQDRRSKGFPVERIELGNETFWRNQRSEAVETPELYVDVARAHFQALKTEDPSIQVSVPVTWRTGGTLHGPWNAALSADQSYYDAVTLHRYIGSGESPEGLLDGLDARRIMIDTAEDIRTQFPGKPIWLSEWSVDAGDNAVSVLGMSDVYLGLIERPDLFASAEYFQIHNHDPFVIYDKSANPKHVKTSRGAAYDILRDVFLDSNLLPGQVTTSQIVPGLDATSAQAVNRDGELVVYAVNKSPVSVPFAVAVDDAAYAGEYTHHAMRFADLDSTSTYGLSESALAEVAPTGNGIVLPPLSISVISGFASDVTPDYGTLIAGWDEWSAVSAATWTATEGEGTAVGVAEAGGIWFNFNNATVENGASGDGRFGAAGPGTANASVAAATDGLSLSNGFDGHIDFTVSDSQEQWRELTGFHFDAGAFRPQAAVDWQLEILAGGSLTPGVLAAGTLTVNAGPSQDDVTINLVGLSDSVLDSGESVTFRLSFSGGGGDIGSSALGHHVFLDNVGVTAEEAFVAGDFNNDGKVGVADYTLWRDHYGEPASSLPNDVTGSAVGIAQYDLWRANYGRSLTQISTSVPEPALSTLTSVCIFLLVACSSQRTSPANRSMRRPGSTADGPSVFSSITREGVSQRGRLARHCLLSLLLISGATLASASEVDSPPNIVLIVADDLGFNQIGCYGETPIETPNLDRLAANGIRFTQTYSGGPVCSPSRVSLFTGRDGRLMSDCSNQVRLEPSDVTLPLVLKHAGYDTALFGKYSIGERFGANGPMAIGFDTWMGMFLINEGHRQYPTFLWRDNQRVRIAANEGGRRSEYAQERFTNEAISYIQQPHDNPFFVVLAYSSPHAELAAPEEYVSRYASKLPKTSYLGMSAESGRDRYARYYPDPVDHPHATLAGMVTALDDYIGRVVTALAERGELENTLLLVTSDNGPHEEGGADPAFFRAAAPYRGIKRDVYDGGIHVPMIAHWPAAITRGRVDATPWAFADVLPTFADLAEVPLTSVARVKTNGVSISGLLRDDPIEMSERTLYWEFTAQVGDPNSGVTAAVWQAARRGPWKAVRLGSDHPVELYNLADDPGESRNVSTANESIAAEIEALFDKHL